MCIVSRPDGRKCLLSAGNSLTHTQWLNTFLDVIYIEVPVARMHGANERTVTQWAGACDKVKELLK